jgi:hypothetical protein
MKIIKILKTGRVECGISACWAHPAWQCTLKTKHTKDISTIKKYKIQCL